MDGAVVPHLTPSEARGMFVREAALRRRMAADMDTLAWLTGNYCAIGVNNPKKYPSKPRNAPRIMQGEEAPAIMTDDEMLHKMLDIARRYSNAHHA